MKVTLLAVVALTAVTWAGAADPECVYRKLRSLSPHWPNPTSCNSFYRCSGKDQAKLITCPTGKEYNPKNGKCSTSASGLCKLSLAAPLIEPNNVCANEVNGAFVAITDKCGEFSICNNQVAYPQICDLGSVFDTVKSSCVPDTNNECWQNACIYKTEGTQLPFTGSCATYIYCDADEKAIKMQCASGSYFSASQKECTTDEGNTHCWENFCIGKTDGSVVADPSDCYAFYGCSEEKPTYYACSDGTYFDGEQCVVGTCPSVSTTSPCTADDESDCANGVKHGDMTVDPQNCRAYYLCNNGEQTSGDCSDGNYFDPALKICVIDSNNVCPANSQCQANEQPTIGDDCWHYNKCVDGQWQQNACATGEYFDVATSKCIIDESDCCPENRALKSRTKRHAAAADNSCPGGIADGTMVANPTECDKYQICENGVLIDGTCGPGNVFDNAQGVCMPDIFNSCWICRGKANGTMLSDSAKCNAYYSCSGGLATWTECPAGQWFDKGTCVVDLTAECINPCSCGLTAVPHPICSKFYRCVDGEAQVVDCGPGEAFDPATRLCSTAVTCAATQCETAPDGESFPVENDDTLFYVCLNGKVTIDKCPLNHIFNTTIKICVPKPSSACDQTKCAKAVSDLTFPSLNCDNTTFCICRDTDAFLESCSDGFEYNATLNLCIFTGPCDPTSCKNNPEWWVTPNYHDADSFCICVAGVPIPVLCPIDHTYDPEMQMCVLATIPDPRCCLNGCVDKMDYFTFASSTNNTGFCICHNEVAQFQECPRPKLFDPTLKLCLDPVEECESGSVCDASKCTDTDFQPFPASNSSGFCYCKDYITHYVPCKNNMIYDDTLGICTMSPCEMKKCNIDMCLTQPEYYPFPSNDDNTGFCYCISGIPVYRACPEGEVFNDIQGICLKVQDECLTKYCDATQCSCVPNLIPFPSLKENDDTAFCYCDNGQVIFDTCKNGTVFNVDRKICVAVQAPCSVCDAAKCASLEQEVPFAALNTTTGYCYCEGSFVFYRSCDGGAQFNTKLGVCQQKSLRDFEINNCDIFECRNRAEYRPFAAKNTTDGYCVCDKARGTVNYEVCEFGQTFDAELGECTEEIIACEPEECFDRLLAETFAAKNTTYGYCSCDVIAVYHHCDIGHIYDSELGMCTLELIGCDPIRCNSSDTSEVFAAQNTTKGFCRCNETDGDISAFYEECAPEKYFDGILGLCIEHENACDSSLCNPRLQFKPFAAMNNRSGFCTCDPISGVAYYRSCKVGEIYNVNLGLCLEDSGICESELCNYLPPQESFAAKNLTTNGFCTCDQVTGIATYHNCATGMAFDPLLKICVEHENACNSSLCNSGLKLRSFAALNDTSGFCSCNLISGVAFYRSCEFGKIFNASLSLCVDDSSICESELCSSLPAHIPFAARNRTNGFCLCDQDIGMATYHSCATGKTFDPVSRLCIKHEQICDSLLCSSRLEMKSFAAFDNIHGFCNCDPINKIAYYHSCEIGKIYNSSLGACVEDSGICESELCYSLPAHVPFAAKNRTNGFCSCDQVSGIATYQSCATGKSFDPLFRLCVEHENVCDSSLCASRLQLRSFAALTNKYGFCSCDPISGIAFYRSCEIGAIYNASLGSCVADSGICESELCGSVAPHEPFAAKNFTNGFCLCDQSSGIATYQNCATEKTFDPISRLCVHKENACNSYLCISRLQFKPFAALNDTSGFCSCDPITGAAFYRSCATGKLFDPLSRMCIHKENACNSSLCISRLQFEPFASLNDTSGFCSCDPITGATFYRSCATGKLFDPLSKMCIYKDNACDSSMCISRIPFKSFAALNGTVGFCTCDSISGMAFYRSCEFGKIYNASLGFCLEDKEICDSETCRFLAPHEPFASMTLTNGFCTCDKVSGIATFRRCSTGFTFDTLSKLCLAMSHGIQKRSVEQPENNLSMICVPDEKRSVPGNCSQYEICLDASWRRRSCPDQKYYNAEQQLCQEPRDDMVCSYARVSGLPPCTNRTESQTLASKTDNCIQYFRCSQKRWRLRNCPKRHYYSRQMRTCVLAEGDIACDTIEPSKDNRTHKCQQTAVRPAPSGCATFLMCLQDAWWYQQCPLGMYFSREHNYCMPNDAGQCEEAAALSSVQEQQLVAGQKCQREGTTRAAQQNCSNYFICSQGEWQLLNCDTMHYFNASLEACIPDVNGTCANSLEIQFEQLPCVGGQRRALLTNCTAYEECNNGQWSRQACAAMHQFDAIVGECVPSDGCCNSSGLRRVCHAGEMRRFPLAANCTQFYYCAADQWRVGTCLKGHTYAGEVNGCVPHAVNNPCLPVWQHVEHEVSDQADEVCLGRDDGQAVPHWSNCLKFYLCINEQPSNLQSCPVGSFFDAALGYCRPNDGSCYMPLSGICAGAGDGDLVADPENCHAYYSCSTLNGTQQHYCPIGEYFHNVTAECRVDHGQCQQSEKQQSKCVGQNHGSRLAHEVYCNIYYVCVRGAAIPVECPNQQYFNQVLGECVDDDLQQCQNGQFVNGNNTIHSCGGHKDGTYLANRSDCTRYFICSDGMAMAQRCGAGAYFDSKQLLCVPDDGSCPYVDDEQPNNQHVPPDPIVCKGQHGYMLPDPSNCNNFYVCVSSNLRLERCYSDHFFNLTLRQCQQYENATADFAVNPGTVHAEQTVEVPKSQLRLETPATKASSTASTQKCSDTPISFNDLCDVIGKNDSIAEQGDCRRYISCEEDKPVSQRCRNGESYDSLLGICRQNDGTCLMENGERVGICNGKHGQLVRDADNCRGYYVCLHGQIIERECAEGEYFSKTINSCELDTLNKCNTERKASKTETET